MAIPRGHAVVGLCLLAALLVGAVIMASLAVADRKQTTGVDFAPGRVIDRFNRSVPDGLGVAASGQAWTIIEGDWSVAAGATVDAVDERSSLAVIELGSADGQVRATMRGVVAGMGIVARYESPDQYLVVDYGRDGRWHASRSRDGTLREVATLRVSTPPTTITTVELRLRGDTVDFFVNDRYADSFSDRSTPKADRVGISFAAGSGGRPVWTQFLATSAATLTASPTTR